MNNRCHHWIARDVRCTHPPELDDGEAIVVRELSVEDVREHIKHGEMRKFIGFVSPGAGAGYTDVVTIGRFKILFQS